MGRELVCNVRTGGKTTSGKALLETKEIIFRGDLRLKIALASLKSVSARDGELHLKWAGWLGRSGTRRTCREMGP